MNVFVGKNGQADLYICTTRTTVQSYSPYLRSCDVSELRFSSSLPFRALIWSTREPTVKCEPGLRVADKQSTGIVIELDFREGRLWGHVRPWWPCTTILQGPPSTWSNFFCHFLIIDGFFERLHTIDKMCGLLPTEYLIDTKHSICLIRILTEHKHWRLHFGVKLSLAYLPNPQNSARPLQKYPIWSQRAKIVSFFFRRKFEQRPLARAQV